MRLSFTCTSLGRCARPEGFGGIVEEFRYSGMHGRYTAGGVVARERGERDRGGGIRRPTSEDDEKSTATSISVSQMLGL